MSRLDAMRLYTIICYRGNASTAQLVAVRAYSSMDAYARLGAQGYTPAGIHCIN